MRPTRLPCVKVCCIADVGEARRAVAPGSTAAGAVAVGLVSAMPSGPGVIEEAVIAEVAAAVSPEDPASVCGGRPG